MSRWYFLNHYTFCFQTWSCDATLWVKVLCKKIDLLFSRSKSLQELVWSNSDNFYCTFWTADPFAINLHLIVDHHKPECFMEKFDCYAQGQGHSKISKYQWMFVQMIFSESMNLSLQNLVWRCIIVSQIAFQKGWFAVFKVKVTVKNNTIKIWLFTVLSELLILLQLNLI